jgi:hypothetical protein
MRRMTAGAVAVAAMSFGVGAGPAAARPADVVDCNHWASFPNLKISSARDMTCRAAVREMRSCRGNISRRFRTPGGFRCSRVSGGPLGGQWRCARAPRAFRFEFGD